MSSNDELNQIEGNINNENNENNINNENNNDDFYNSPEQNRNIFVFLKNSDKVEDKIIKNDNEDKMKSKKKVKIGKVLGLILKMIIFHLMKSQKFVNQR